MKVNLKNMLESADLPHGTITCKNPLVRANIVFIPNNTPSSKNSKINTKQGSFNSKTVQKYLREHGIQSYSSSRKEVKYYKIIPMTFPVGELRALFKDANFPVTIGMHFARNSKHKWDFHNACQIILDLFTAFDIIPDDNMDYIIPQCYWMNNKHFSYDKEKPGVYITIL